MIIFKSIVEHQTVVSITEASFKMASTLCQKWLTIFVKKFKILYCSDHTNLFKFIACGPNTYQIMYEETLAV